MSDRTVECDLKFLIAVFNWAAKSKDEQGRPLFGSNPLRGLKTPAERNPTRVVLAEEEYRALLRVSREVDWRFHVALVLAHETGHRIGAIRKLRWSHIDLGDGAVRWRAEHEKTGYEHCTPVDRRGPHRLGRGAKEESRNWGHSGATRIHGCLQVRGPVAGPLLGNRAQKLAGLEPKRGRGWHSLRRKCASDLMDQPLKVLCELGG